MTRCDDIRVQIGLPSMLRSRMQPVSSGFRRQMSYFQFRFDFKFGLFNLFFNYRIPSWRRSAGDARTAANEISRTLVVECVASARIENPITSIISHYIHEYSIKSNLETTSN